MNKIEKIKAEIERRYNDNLQAEETAHTGHFGSAAKEDYDLLSFIESLEKEQPQGVDEAAIKYLRQYDKDNDGEEPCATEVFRAGVKFQAEQGYSREVEVKVDAGGYPYINEIELYDYDNDKPLAKKGDKVRIQITKVE